MVYEIDGVFTLRFSFWSLDCFELIIRYSVYIKQKVKEKSRECQVKC